MDERVWIRFKATPTLASLTFAAAFAVSCARTGTAREHDPAPTWPARIPFTEPTKVAPAQPAKVAGGPVCTKLSARPPTAQPCQGQNGTGLRDPEGYCDSDLESVRELGTVQNRPFDSIDLLQRRPQGFWLLSSMKLAEPGAGDEPPQTGGVAVVELSADGAPLEQCLATSQDESGGTAGIRDAALDSQGRLVLTGWIWGKDLSFGGTPLSSSPGYRNSYLAVLTQHTKHAWSHALGNVWADATSVATDTAGNVALAGTYCTALDLGTTTVPAPTYPSLFVAKYDGHGRLLWVRVSPLGTQHLAQAVAFADDGHVMLVGGYDQTVNFGTPLPAAVALSLPQCSDPYRTPHDTRRMFWVEFDAAGKEVTSQSFGELDAQAFDITSSPEGDFIVSGGFRGSLSFGRGTLQAPATRGKCGCNVDCAYPMSRFVARLDRKRDVVLQQSLPEALLVHAQPGPARSTVVVQGIPVSYRQGPEPQLPNDYRWKVAIWPLFSTQSWNREFQRLDVKAAAPFGSDRLTLLVHAPERSTLSLLIYRPGIWHR